MSASSTRIKIAIPTDFPPQGMVGTDLKPQGWMWIWPVKCTPPLRLASRGAAAGA